MPNLVTSTPSFRGTKKVTGWSWAGVAGLYATFDTDLSDIRPSALVEALGTVAHRFGHAACQHKDARS